MLTPPSPGLLLVKGKARTALELKLVTGELSGAQRELPGGPVPAGSVEILHPNPVHTGLSVPRLQDASAEQSLLTAPASSPATTPFPHDSEPLLPRPVLIWVHKHVSLACLSLPAGDTRVKWEWEPVTHAAPASPKFMSLLLPTPGRHAGG